MKVRIDKKKTKTKSDEKPLTATEELIRTLLYNRHKDRQWVFFPEMIVSTEDKKDNEKADSRLDAWAFNIWPSRNYERITYEIKISRDDFKRELRQPEKRLPGLSVSNSFYYVMPAGVSEPSEIPDPCGLIVIRRPRGRDYHILSMKKKAVWRDIPMPDIGFWASLARRTNESEGLYNKELYNQEVLDQYARSKQK